MEISVADVMRLFSSIAIFYFWKGVGAVGYVCAFS